MEEGKISGLNIIDDEQREQIEKLLRNGEGQREQLTDGSWQITFEESNIVIICTHDIITGAIDIINVSQT